MYELKSLWRGSRVTVAWILAHDCGKQFTLRKLFNMLVILPYNSLSIRTSLPRSPSPTRR